MYGYIRETTDAKNIVALEFVDEYGNADAGVVFNESISKEERWAAAKNYFTSLGPWGINYVRRS